MLIQVPALAKTPVGPVGSGFLPALGCSMVLDQDEAVRGQLLLSCAFQGCEMSVRSQRVVGLF